MNVAYSKAFIKQAKKLDSSLRQKLFKSIETFTVNPTHPSLRNHQLKGKYKLYRSINITGDVRAINLQQENGAIFDAVGTHSELYG